MNERPAAGKKILIVDDQPKTRGLAAFLPNNFLSTLSRMFSPGSKWKRSSRTGIARRFVHGLERRKHVLLCTETVGDVHRAVRHLRTLEGHRGLTVGQYIRDRLEGRAFAKDPRA